MEEIEANNNNNGSQDLETEFAERSMWLMKCPSRQPLPLADDPVAKVILSIDPLATVVMELSRAESGNVPKRFGLDMSKDFIPMSVFSESSSQGTMSVEGKIKDKFHMNTRTENMESYGKLCRERASKYMCKN
ncbi:hypothetical protein Rs2_14112 [Raphanus sativus]|nr:hypothetical protein Rs2_14112 [Raphanus sativus]